MIVITHDKKIDVHASQGSHSLFKIFFHEFLMLPCLFYRDIFTDIFYVILKQFL